MARDLGIQVTEKEEFYFISYNSEDKDRVADYVKSLDEYGLQMWYDKGLHVGDKWENEISSRIEKCQAVIMFITKGIFEKDKSYVHKEYKIATEFFDKKIFTLGKTEKTLLTLFLKEARVALGKITDDYHDTAPLDFSSAPRGSFQLLECYLTEFLLVLLRGGDESGSTILRSENSRALGQSSLTELIVAYLEENVNGAITLSDICTRFFIGKTQLCRLFDDHVGKSPMEYFSNLKIKEAKKLLRQGELSVSRIADLLSYSSIHNFSRSFKKTVGISPTDYRKKINDTL